MNISFTENGEKLVDGSKTATTRFNKDHWLGWICHRRDDFMRYIGSPPREECNRINVQDYLDALCWEVFRDVRDGKPIGYNRDHTIPHEAMPRLKMFYGSLRSSKRAIYLGEVLVYQVKVGPFNQLTLQDAIDDGFPSLEEFGKLLFDLHESRLSNLHTDLDPRTCPHVWVHMKYVWLSGPIQIPEYQRAMAERGGYPQESSILTIQDGIL